MKISDKEKKRILELHLKTKMKPWLFNEHNPPNRIIDSPGEDWEFETPNPPFTNQLQANAYVDYIRNHYPSTAKNLGLDSKYPTLGSSELKTAWNIFDPKSTWHSGYSDKDKQFGPGYIRDRYEWVKQELNKKALLNREPNYDKIPPPNPFTKVNYAFDPSKSMNDYMTKSIYYGKSFDIKDYRWFERTKFLEFVRDTFPTLAKSPLRSFGEDTESTDITYNLEKYIDVYTGYDYDELIDALKKANAKKFGFGEVLNVGEEWYYYKARVLSQWRNELKKQRLGVPSWLEDEISRDLNQTFISQQGSEPKKMVGTEELNWHQRLSPLEKQKLHNDLESLRLVLGVVSFIAGWIPHPIAQGVAYGADTARALTYIAEDDNYSAGLELLGVFADVGIDRIGGRGIDLIQDYRKTNRLKKLGKNLAQEQKDGVNSLDLFTKTEMRAMDAIGNKQNLQNIQNNMEQYQKYIIDEYLKDPKKFKDGYNFKKFIDTKKPQSLFGEPDFRKKYWEDWRTRKIWRPLGNVSMFALQGLAHTSVEFVLKPKTREYLYFKDETDRMIKEELHKLGVEYEYILNIFGGDINNPSDIEKFEKAWFSPKFDSEVFGKPTKGWRPTIQNAEGVMISSCDTPDIPSEFRGSLYGQDDRFGPPLDK